MEIRFNFARIDNGKKKEKNTEEESSVRFEWKSPSANNVRVRALNIPNTDTFIS